jgi:hypothetical protein
LLEWWKLLFVTNPLQVVIRTTICSTLWGITPKNMLHGSSSRAWVLDNCHAFFSFNLWMMHALLFSLLFVHCMQMEEQKQLRHIFILYLTSDFCYLIWNFYFHAGYSFFSCLTTIFWIYIWYLKSLPILDHLFYGCLLIRQFSKSLHSY